MGNRNADSILDDQQLIDANHDAELAADVESLRCEGMSDHDILDCLSGDYCQSELADYLDTNPS